MKRLFHFLFFFVISCGLSFNISAAASLSDGIDWSLPSYASQSTNGGLIGETSDTDSEIPAVFIPIVWRLVETSKNNFNWSSFEDALALVPNKKVLVRLEVNSACHAPQWANLPSLDNKSLQFWKSEYRIALKRFVDAFAQKYAGNTRIIGVHLGIGDGEYYQDNNGDGIADSSNCPTQNTYDSLVNGSGRDGWGEFWVDENKGEDTQSITNGLTVNNFETSVKAIMDIYINAFDVNKNKLAFVGLGNVFGISSLDAKLPIINAYAKTKGVGNRQGEIEDWMRYTGNIQGSNLVTANNTDSSCSLTFDEKYADRIASNHLFWGDENEFYGPESWIIDSMGPVSNQPYRFYMSSLRALQLRRNYISIRKEGLDLLRESNQSEFQSKNFITYLTKTFGRTRADTPDAFVILGEKTINTSSGLFPDEYKAANTSERCLIHANNRSFVTVDQFGRWLSVVSKTEADEAMRKDMPENEAYWGIGNMISDRNNNDFHELYARKSNAIFFDINDQLIAERCTFGCDIDIKVSFKDDHIMGLQVTHENGESNVLTTQGGGKIRTATFTLKSTFTNGHENADFAIKTTNGSKLSVLITRININSALTPSTPAIPTGISPTGTTSSSVTFIWNAVAGATDYEVSYENDASGNWITSEFLPISAFECASGTCRYTMNNVERGSNVWWVRAKNNSSESDWSDGFIFNVANAVPDVPTGISPTGTTSSSVTFTWNAVAGATDYEVSYENDASHSWVTSDYLPLSTFGCSSGTGVCRYIMNNVENGGNAWWVRAKNATGESAWSKGLDFTAQ